MGISIIYVVAATVKILFSIFLERNDLSNVEEKCLAIGRIKKKAFFWCIHVNKLMN